MARRSDDQIDDFVSRLVRWAVANDERRRGGEGDPTPDEPTAPVSVGAIAAAWGTLKFLFVAVTTPVWSPITAVRAIVNHRRARRLTAAHPDVIRDVRAGRTPPPPGNRVERIDSEIRLFISSDIHRSVSGRTDWPRRQGTKFLYDAMLDHYADDEWHLCENGDIEDFWQIGGSTYGALYDAMRVLGGVLEIFDRPRLLTSIYRAHVDRVVDNNRATYDRLASSFSLAGRYYRTVGNHDSPLSRSAVASRLRDHLGRVSVVDHIALVDASGEMRCFISHGHHTDGWCAPERDGLGRLSTWLANTLVDVPLMNTPEGLPPENATETLLSSASNRLLTVNSTFGANATYDSLDEELLFEALEPLVDDGLWILLGHTHIPLFEPWSRNGRRWTHYVNSGSGVTRELVTGIEWDGTGPEPVVRLVAWTYADDMTPPEAVVTADRHGRPVARFELTPGVTGRLHPTPSRSPRHAVGTDEGQLTPV